MMPMPATFAVWFVWYQTNMWKPAYVRIGNMGSRKNWDYQLGTRLYVTVTRRP